MACYSVVSQPVTFHYQYSIAVKIITSPSGIAVYVDHSDMAEVEKFFKRIDEETNGQLDILVNNAFSAIPQITKINGRKFWEMEPELWDQVGFSIRLNAAHQNCASSVGLMEHVLH